jgi:hypothetical protein
MILANLDIAAVKKDDILVLTLQTILEPNNDNLVATTAQAFVPEKKKENTPV